MTPIQEEDQVPARHITRLMVIGIAMIAIGAVSSWVLGSRRARDLGSGFTHQQPVAIAIVEERSLRGSLFNLDRPGSKPSDRLSEYGWVNRDEHIAHIPIERAMDVEVERQWRQP